MARTSFPDGFLWGAATSAYQVEGSPLADGAGPSIWHRFAHTPDLVANDENGDEACDHYNRFEEDVRLMAEIGLQSYRFSINWGRILPEGKGRVNQKGIEFYSRLVDALLENNIKPNATLYHWDLPAALDDLGGWLNPDIRHWFAEYAQIMFRALDDRVPMWATINEPWVITDGGYLTAALAPGHENKFETPIASHHLMRAHAEAVRVYRSIGKNQIGIVINLEPKMPDTDSEEDNTASRRADIYMNHQYLDALFFGKYPDGLAEIFGDAWPDWSDADLEGIDAELDFLGINYYSRGIMAHDDDGGVLQSRQAFRANSVYTDTDWEVYPQGLSEILKWVSERYGNVPLYVTENGAAFYDPPSSEDLLEDVLRMAYYRSHLKACLDAIDQGVNLRGYYAWSLLDNFEWSHGYEKRFGIIHVDYETQQRTLKGSAHQYREIIQSNGSSLFS